MSIIVQKATHGTYHCSKRGYEILKEIARKAGFSSENIVARLAIGRSLVDKLDVKTDARLSAGLDSNGKELKGITLLSPEVASIIVSLVVQHYGKLLENSEDIKELIRLHWNRGLLLLEEDLDQQDGDIDNVLIRYVEQSCLTIEGETEEEYTGLGDLLDAKIVGQDEAKRQIRRLLKEAKGLSPMCLSESIIFTGPASVGKTLFSQTIAESLMLPYVETTGTSLKSAEQLFEQIDNVLDIEDLSYEEVGHHGGLPLRKYPPLVIFIDECHQLKRPIQDTLLTMTEPSSRRAILQHFVADMSSATFLFATTDIGLIEKALKTRCREINLKPYEIEDIVGIIGRIYKGWSPEVRKLIAMAGRLTPRIAKERAKDLDRILKQDYKGQKPSESIVVEIMDKEWGQDRLGMTDRDRRYLRVIESANGPIGGENIAQQLGIELSEVENDIEPFMMRLGLIKKGQSGRELTEDGKRLIRGEEQ
jgi:Holliday junction DNA helicase RuvB